MFQLHDEFTNSSQILHVMHKLSNVVAELEPWRTFLGSYIPTMHGESD